MSTVEKKTAEKKPVKKGTVKAMVTTKPLIAQTTHSTDVELNAFENIRQKVEYLKINWYNKDKSFYDEFGAMTQINMAKCIGCSSQSVALHWKVADVVETIPVKIKTKKTESIIDDEPQRTTSNKMITYSTENSNKSLKELYADLSEAYGELETAESKIELIKTQIQGKEFSKNNPV